MIEIVSAIVGFAAPFIPEVLKFFTRKQDQAHELAILNLQIQKGAQEHLWRMDEIAATADIAEAKELHKPAKSFGVQILDAAKGHSMSGWALYPAFYLFVALDFLAGMVRPGITYAAFGFYMAVKWAKLSVALSASTLSVALLDVWDDSDRALVVLVLSYWFGHRAAKAAFGGSAMSSARGT